LERYVDAEVPCAGNAERVMSFTPRIEMSYKCNIFCLAQLLKRGMPILCLLASIAAFGAEKSYVVKREDTLYGIARRYGVATSRLAERNGLSKNAWVYVGQKLIIPDKSTTSSLSKSVQRAIDKAPVSPGRWKYIVIHHSGVDEGTLKSIDRYHREERHMENGLAYHFLIGNGNGLADGKIAVGDRWKKQLDGGHLHSLEQNKISIGICLIGNFDKSKPTKKQMRSLKELTLALMKRCHLSASAVKTHKQINVTPTECPGTKFPTKSFLADLKESKG
jgi:N-acetylmuramoyl-L-alanine amidase/LysM domain